ncbi:MAG TPA: RNA-binding S4 domain-containing protein [Bacteroidales bacterium]|nr:RNA-binding S4 domain-containing protein [Bacteroidales bacterium]HKK77236.1 RNA-binding S4 domain-containing protein [Saprospiraceae bacterium]
MGKLKKVRVDKWLWSVRIFKSRTIASNACKTGKIKVNDKVVKPSTTIECQDLVEVKKNGFNFQFKVIELIQKRVGAPIAQTCYEDLTTEEELNKYKDWYVGKGLTERREKGAGRPTKKERRNIEQFKEDIWFFDDE